MIRRSHPGAFTLVELLVSMLIVVLLAGMLGFAALRLRKRIRMIQVHSDLRQVTLAIQLYRTDHNGDCPPTRFSCSSGAAHQLPVELLDYGLPRGRDTSGTVVVALEDPFTPGTGYRYRAVGRAIMNETTVVENMARLWIPDNFPRQPETTGRYYRDPRTSPVTYAVWSMGPDPESPKFHLPGRLPVPSGYWMRNAGDTGVIVHLQRKNGVTIISP